MWAQTFLTWSFPGSTVVDWGIQVVLCAHKSKYLSTYSFHLFQSIDWSTRMVKAGILIFFLLTILGATLAAAPGWSIWYQHIHKFLIIDGCNYICNNSFIVLRMNGMWQIPGDAASPEIPGIPGLDFNPLSTFGFPLVNIWMSPSQHLDRKAMLHLIITNNIRFSP